MLPCDVGFVELLANEIVIQRDSFRSCNIVFNMSIKASAITVNSYAFQEAVIGTAISSYYRPSLLLQNVALLEDRAFSSAKIDSIVIHLKPDRDSVILPISQNTFEGIKSGVRNFEYVHINCEKRSYSLYSYSPPNLCPISEAVNGAVKLKLEDCERFPLDINCNFSQILLYSNIDVDPSTSYHVVNGLFWTNYTIDRYFIRPNVSVSNFTACIASQSLLHRVIVQGGQICTTALMEQQTYLFEKMNKNDTQLSCTCKTNAFTSSCAFEEDNGAIAYRTICTISDENVCSINCQDDIQLNLLQQHEFIFSLRKGPDYTAIIVLIVALVSLFGIVAFFVGRIVLRRIRQAHSKHKRILLRYSGGDDSDTIGNSYIRLSLTSSDCDVGLNGEEDRPTISRNQLEYDVDSSGIIRQLGYGNFSVVKKGRLFVNDDNNEQENDSTASWHDVAIKQLRSLEHLHLWKKERSNLEFLKQFHHENIAEFVGAVSAKDSHRFYLCTKLCPEGSLEKVIDILCDYCRN